MKRKLGFDPCGSSYDTVGYRMAKDGRVVCVVCDPRRVNYPYRDGELPWLGGHYLSGEGGDRITDTFKLHEAVWALEDGKPLCCGVCGGSMVWRDIDHTGAGGYSGSTAERSNLLAITEHFQALEEAKDEPGWPEENAHWREETYDHGYRVLQAQIMAESQDVHPAIKEVEAALRKAGLFDEDHCSMYEHELEEEAWPELRNDFWRAVGKRCEGEDELEERWEALNDAEKTEEAHAIIDERFYSLADAAGEYWEPQSADTMYIAVDKVARRMTQEDLRDLLDAIEAALKEAES